MYLQRGDAVNHPGLGPGRVLFVFANGTPDAPFPWAKIAFGATFCCVRIDTLRGVK